MSPMLKFILCSGAGSAMLAVILGAFGAHGLKGKISEHFLSVYQTGVQYQLIHALALILVGLLYQRFTTPPFVLVALLFLCGTLLFSGSLYGLALGGPRWLGPITPLGGMCFICGWGALIYAVVKS